MVGELIIFSRKRNTSVKSRVTGVGLIFDRQYEGVCEECKKIDYHLAPNSFKLNLSNQLLTNDIIDLTNEFKNIEFITDNKERDVYVAQTILNNLRMLGNFCFKNSKIPAKEIELQRIRTNSWYFSSKQEQISMILELFEHAGKVVDNEDRVLRVEAPCFVFGDIHGNFRDLLKFEKIFWPSIPVFVDCKYLFLGDYVDRGAFGIECVCYLLALKILFPKHFLLVRGNHEIRQLQKQFTFERECQRKFPNSDVWDRVNQVFELLPLCAVVSDSIFCAHGGIPKSVLQIKQLNKAPKPLIVPQNEFPAAWEIMWNDCIDQTDFENFCEFIPANNKSRYFIDNTKRGTAFYFSNEAVYQFFEANRLTHVIRAHEVINKGYAFHVKGAVITVFSSSRYCQMDNTAACIFIDHNNLRVVQIKN